MADLLLIIELQVGKHKHANVRVSLIRTIIFSTIPLGCSSDVEACKR
jgi:hypothetical protein